MNKESIKLWLTEQVNFFSDKDHEGYSSWYELGKDIKGNTMAIVCGYYEDEPFMYFGILKWNSCMSEAFYDWLMPYDKATGEVDDTELRLTNDDDDIQYLLDAYNRYVNGGSYV